MSESITEHPKLQKAIENTRLKEWDADAWKSYLAEAQATSNPDIIRACFNELVSKFPTNASYWIKYAQYEIKLKQFTNLEAIFAKCLLSVPDVNLWQFYLNYVVSSQEALGDTSVVASAFDFVLKVVGFDSKSGSIWSDYLSFVKKSAVHSTNLDIFII